MCSALYLQSTVFQLQQSVSEIDWESQVVLLLKAERCLVFKVPQGVVGAVESGGQLQVEHALEETGSSARQHERGEDGEPNTRQEEYS